jgi:hypothetical protein
VIRKIAIVGFLSCAIAFNSYAHDSDRLDQLEKDVQETQRRLSKLESLLSSSGNAQKPLPSGEGWKAVTNWRKLTTDMSTGEVQRTLGEPYRVDGGVSATWYYQNGGRLHFFRDKLNSWTEPLQ